MCFIDELATHRSDLTSFGLSKPIEQYEYDELMVELREGGVFSDAQPHFHINNWDFNRILKLSEKTNFSSAVLSKPGGSISGEMQGVDIDRTHPEMSLYVDLVK